MLKRSFHLYCLIRLNSSHFRVSSSFYDSTSLSANSTSFGILLISLIKPVGPSIPIRMPRFRVHGVVNAVILQTNQAHRFSLTSQIGSDEGPWV